MRVFRGLDDLPAFKNAVITIGTFDGVHKGHQKLIERIKKLSEEVDGESIILTFHPHPRFVVNPHDKSLKLINTLEEKVALLERYGVDNTVVAPFSKEFANIPAIEYVKDFLVGKFHPKVIVIGYDHRFGKDRKGDISLLREYKDIFGYELVEINKQQLDDIDISSTKVRKALESGDVALAHQLMGHPYHLGGYVTKGQRIGHELGFPTANIQIPVDYKLIPANGVYAVKVQYKEQALNAMLNIGYRPTFEGREKTIEVHIFDFEEDIYGEWLQVNFIEYIRPEKKFDGKEALQQQLQRDKARASEILSA